MEKNLQKCIDVIAEASGGEITHAQAKSLVQKIMDEVSRPGTDLTNTEARIKELGAAIINEDKMASALQRRNALLTHIATARIHIYAEKFGTRGEGLLAFMNGSNKKAEGGRLSVYYQEQAVKHKYIGRLVDSLEKVNALTEFKSGELDKQVFQELFQLGKENPTRGVSGSSKAQAMAEVIHGIHMEMIDRENRAGGFVHKLEGYIMRQMHDGDEIRRAGGIGFSPGSNEKSFHVWSNFILPLLDQDATFAGVDDKMKFLKGAHEGIITGVHDRPLNDVADVNAQFTNTGSLARKVSTARSLHFKDAESAYAYNQRFGMKNFREATLRQLQTRASAISLMENFGPNPERSFERIIREMKSAVKGAPDDHRQLASLQDWKVEASFKELMGSNNMSKNPSLTRMMQAVRSVTNMSKLGASTITSFADKMFMQSEASFQGIKTMDTLGKQFMAPLEGRLQGERHSMLNLMGAGLDGFIGNVVSRFAGNEKNSGLLYRLQSKFMQINGQNWWNDIHKGAITELMAAHLADHAHLPSEKLPPELQKVLSLYDIKGSAWDLIRSTAHEVEGRKYITPDGMLKLSDDQIKTFAGAQDDTNSIARTRDKLDTQLRTYFADRADIAIPTPGNQEHVYQHWNSQAGTPLGEAVRMLMMFKSMPITVFKKVVQREIYGHGSDTMLQWLRNDRMGNFRMLNLLATTTVAGYVSGMVKDALKGRTPKDITAGTIQDAMLRGGGLGIYGDMLFNEYDRSYRSFLDTAAGPVIGQADSLADIYSKIKEGKLPTKETGKLALNNAPFINLFYIRPVLDYLILWHIQEMSDPGSLRRSERKVERDNGQGFFIRPSETVNR